MKNTKQFTLFLIILLFSVIACDASLSLPENAIKIIDLVNDPINVPAPKPNESSEVVINFGAGKLFINPSTEQNLITGTATYNVASLIPEISTSGNKVTLKQGTVDYDITGLPNFLEVENSWDIKLNSLPINLEINSWAFINGQFEFGGMAIEELRLISGTSSIKSYFSVPNLTTMTTFRVITGASSIELNNLANANFSLFDFDGGAGNYILDFSGTLQRDATIDINALASRIVIKVPVGITASVQVANEETNIVLSGDWIGEGTNYTKTGNGPTLVFKIDLGAGQLTLEN